MRRLVDLDELLDFLLNVTEISIGDDYYRDTFNNSLKANIEEFYKTVTPSVEVGQTVWVIKGSEYYGYDIIECTVTKMQVKARSTFTAHQSNSAYNGTFTKNSIGKKVFFTKQEAEHNLNVLLKKKEKKDEKIN